MVGWFVDLEKLWSYITPNVFTETRCLLNNTNQTIIKNSNEENQSQPLKKQMEYFIATRVARSACSILKQPKKRT